MNQDPFADLNARMERIQQAFGRFDRAMEQLEWAMRKSSRRIKRNIARIDRRPALIHNGGKP